MEPSKLDQIFMMFQKNFLVHFFLLRFQTNKNMKFQLPVRIQYCARIGGSRAVKSIQDH